MRVLHAILPSLGFALFASLPQQAVSQQSAPDLSAPAQAWAVEAAKNEVQVVTFKSGYVRYRTRTVNSKGDQTRDLIESRDGPVARLVLVNGHPLTAEQDAAERSRLEGLLDDPSAFHKHVHEDDNGKHTAADLIRILPDAMLYSYVPGQPQRPDHDGPEVVLDFKPNPAWSPPTTVSEALTGLQGRLWIDARTHRLTHLDSTVFRPINIGFGVLVHVNPGGTFSVDQVFLPDGRPIVTRFTEHVDLRALLVKSLHENEEITASDFEPVETMSYTDAIHRLLDSPLPR